MVVAERLDGFDTNKFEYVRSCSLEGTQLMFLKLLEKQLRILHFAPMTTCLSHRYQEAIPI